MKITEHDAARFWWKVRKAGPDDCWEWTANRNLGGYGTFGVNRKTYIATHVSLELSGRPRPDGLLALHACHNRGCVNPRHLRWGTHWENMTDAFEHGSLPRAFTDEQAETIRKDARPVTIIANENGCSTTVIWRLKHGFSYKERSHA